MSERVNKRWDLVVVGIVVNTCLGTVYSWSVFRAPLEQALAMTAAQSGLPYSVFLAAFAFSMPLGGLLIAKLGTRATLWIGSVFVGAGWVGAGLVGQSGGLLLAYGVVGGIGVGLSYGVPLAVAGSWFPDRRGLAIGLTLAGFGVSPFVTAPVAEILILTVGVRNALVVLGVAFFVIVAGLAALFRRRVAPGGVGTTTVADSSLDPRQMLKSRRFYGLWSCYALGTLAGLTAIGLTASFAQEVVELPATTAALAVSLFGILNGVGRPVFGGLHDRLGTRPTIFLSYLLIALGAAVSMAAAAGTVLVFFLGFGILWLMLGGWLAIAPAATGRLFGTRHYASNYGIMYTAYGVGALIGGGVSGVLYERFGSYSPLFLFIIITCVLGAGLAFLFVPSRARIAA